MTRPRTAELPPSCPLGIRGQVAGAGSCPLVSRASRARGVETRFDLGFVPAVVLSVPGAGRGQVGGRYQPTLPAGRGQVGAGRGQVKTATCPQGKGTLTCTDFTQGAVRAGNFSKFRRYEFSESDIRGHNAALIRRSNTHGESSQKKLPLLPPAGGAR